MSRQFRFFLLPSDAEALIADLRDRVGLKLIDAKSSKPEPVELHSPMQESFSHSAAKVTVSANCYLMPPANADIKLRYIGTQGYWLVDEQFSDVIEFCGSQYDGEILVAGRFYFSTNFLLNDAIWSKRREFLNWTDRIFRRTKTTLTYSKGLDAYIALDAQAWRANGGQFAWMRLPDREPQWAVERE
jgi:hypothetical protein